MGETFVEYLRPQILTGVDLVPTRSDLLDRCLLIELNPIAPDDRLTEGELAELQNQITPQVFGALLTALSIALKTLPTLPRQRLPRMADFARLGIAAESALGFAPGSFMAAYTANIAAAIDHAIESNPVATAIRDVLGDSTRWEVSSEALAQRLKQNTDEPRVQKLTARALGRMLSGSLKADLNAIGIVVEHVRDMHSRRWVISRDGGQADRHEKITSLTSLTSYPSHSKGLRHDVSMTLSDPPEPDNVIEPEPMTLCDPPMTLCDPITSCSEPRRSKDYDVNDVYDVISGGLSASPHKNPLVPHKPSPDLISIDCNPSDDDEEWIDA